MLAGALRMNRGRRLGTVTWPFYQVTSMHVGKLTHAGLFEMSLTFCPLLVLGCFELALFRRFIACSDTAHMVCLTM